MASSFNNRHWPSMFRSKHAAEPWQTTTQPDMMSSSPPSLLSAGGGSSTTTGRCLKHPVSSGFSGGEERSPDPRPRWNPKPEQIRILEAIFNSGMINPPRDEIPRIRMRLQEYGHVGDANVFYWFQNRKSRSKHKLRTAGRLGLTRAPALGRAAAAAGPVTTLTPPPPPQQALIQHHHHHPVVAHRQLLAASPAQQDPTSSSSSSSDRSSGSSKLASAAKPPAVEQAMSVTEAMDLLGPLAAACPGQMYYHHQGHHPVAAPAPEKVQLQDFVAAASDEPVFQPWPQGCCLSAAEVATILGGGQSQSQYMPLTTVPVQQQQLPAGAFLGLQCNEVVAEPTVAAGDRTCAWGPPAAGQFWPGAGGGADHHHHQVGKSSTTAANNTTVLAREVAAHEVDDATRLGLLQYGGFGASTAAMEAAAALAASSPAAGDAVTVASVAGGTMAGLKGLPTASTNGVVANYDLLQGLVTTVPGSGAVVSTGGAPTDVAVADAAAPTDSVVVLCITDSVTGKSVAHGVAAARLDVRAHFGEAAVLLRGVVGERGLDQLEHVPVDASGCTVQPLQHGAFYYVLV